MKTSSLFLFALILTFSPIHSAEQVPAFPDAKQKAKETGTDFIVCAYGKSWDTVGQKFKKQTWDIPATFTLLEPKTLITTIDVLDSPTKEEEENQKKINNGFNESLRSLPQVFLFDSAGHCYATLYGDELPKTSGTLAKELQKLQNLRKKRDAYIEQSKKAPSAKEKGRLLGLAGDIPGLSRPKSLLEELKKADPKDESGYQKRFTFNIYDYHKYLKEPKETALKAFNEVVSSPAYSAQQKQLVLGLQSTYLRKNKASQKEIEDTLKKMRNLAPDSLQGKAAVNAAKAYIK